MRECWRFTASGRSRLCQSCPTNIARRTQWVRREQLIEMLVMEENRLEHVPAKAKAVRHNLRSHIDYLRKQIKQADDDLDREVRNSPLWDKYEMLSSVPGVGRVLSIGLLSDLPRVGPAQPRRDRRTGERGAFQLRQWDPAWPAQGCGRPHSVAASPVYGRAFLGAVQSSAQAFLPAPARGR